MKKERRNTNDKVEIEWSSESCESQCSFSSLYWRARNGLLPCVGGYTCVQRRDGRGNTCVAKTHTHSLDPRLNRTTCCVDFQCFRADLSGLRPRLFHLEFSLLSLSPFPLFKFYSKSFLLLAALKKARHCCFFLFWIKNSISKRDRFYSGKFNVQTKFLTNLMFRLPIRIDYCSWIVIISLLLYTLLRSVFLLQAIRVHIYLYLIIDLKRLRLS